MQHGIACVLFVLSAAGLAAADSPKPAAAPAHWDYGKEQGPSAWSKLDPAFATCAAGRSQSPIDLSSKAQPLTPEQQAKLGAATVAVEHRAHVGDVLNNGHTVQVNYADADLLIVGNVSHALVQYHFHSPSEHTVDGKHFPMEMHLVHKATSGKLAVIGVLIEQGAAHAAFEPVWGKLPTKEGDDRKLGEVNVDIDQLLPAERTAYRYDGSLTTPPCSEDVSWFVMKTPIQLSEAQIEAFEAVIHGNNRPPQPLHGRAVATEKLAFKQK